MKVRMLAEINGTRDGVDWPKRGQTIDLPDHEAADLILGGLASAADDTEAPSAPSPAPVAVADSNEADAASDTPAAAEDVAAAHPAVPVKRGPGRPRKNG